MGYAHRCSIVCEKEVKLLDPDRMKDAVRVWWSCQTISRRTVFKSPLRFLMRAISYLSAM